MPGAKAAAFGSNSSRGVALSRAVRHVDFSHKPTVQQGKQTMRASIMMLCAAAALAGCQSRGPAEIVEGSWVSNDGVFVATFADGAFNSRHRQNGDVLVADGRYTSTGSGLALTWTSVVTNELRTADCTLTASDQVTCRPSVGAVFSMTRANAVS
ncbi:hypothetical protein RDV64_22575 [Acuticoccus sp. MNP-M23]|uniref:hypothetical protein n=1 Tax=Acuticoccus sp. MNP-M23 TaxID=3072793 RepID=UPI0028155BCB|nr:hypothetical protein [Acuticoccus sp. MNP-M23]WMS42804.1 hypothetical protein RDV64_22575 [Acuticoccus sp. MNP-M23]